MAIQRIFIHTPSFLCNLIPLKSFFYYHNKSLNNIRVIFRYKVTVLVPYWLTHQMDLTHQMGLAYVA